MKLPTVALLLLSLASPSSAQYKRFSAGYRLTGGSDGYVAHEGHLDAEAQALDWLGFYGGGTVLTDSIYERVWSGGAGLEFLVGAEDRFRFGVHMSEGRFDKKVPGWLEGN